ncbi:MAG: leucine-rich repeat domain-containing protein [Oscillospiraceae bacterium]|nr:leucine-rich repeat domain-containing protein [Oscillospiraceae bacterium]
MRTKKLIAAAAAFMLALGTFSVLPAVTDTENGIAVTAGAASSDFVIKKDKDGDKYISGYKGKGGDITIPKGVYVGAEAFKGNMDITGVTFSGEGNSFFVGTKAFADCANLKKVVFKGDAYFKENSFSNCVNLKSVEIKGTCLSIGNSAFENCELLEKFSIKKHVKKADLEQVGIGYDAFYNCYSLRSFVVPSNFTDIYNGAFLNCVNLKSLKIPASVKIVESEEGINSHFGCFEKVSSKKELENSLFMYGSSAMAIESLIIADGKKSSYFQCLNPSGKTFTSAEFYDTLIDCEVKKMTPVKLTVTVTKGSDAEKYCKENKIAYKYAK